MPDIGVQISPAVADRLREAAERDGRLGAGAVTQLAQDAVAAWASAAGGDDRALTALGGPDAASWQWRNAHHAHWKHPASNAAFARTTLLPTLQSCAT